MPAITPASVPSKIDGMTGTPRRRAVSTNSSVASAGASGSISIVSTPVARNQSGETW